VLLVVERERMYETSRRHVLNKFKDQNSPCQSDSRQETQDTFTLFWECYALPIGLEQPRRLESLNDISQPKSPFSRSQQSIGHSLQPHSSKSLRHIPVLWTKLVILLGKLSFVHSTFLAGEEPVNSACTSHHPHTRYIFRHT
jgi:hypothetical protein